MPLLIRSEEHTSELQSHSEISYAVFCLKKKKRSRCRKHILASINFWMRQNLTLMRLGRCVNTGNVSKFRFFFFNDPATTEIYTNLNTLSLQDALPICMNFNVNSNPHFRFCLTGIQILCVRFRSEEHTSVLQSHSEISYAVFCLKKKKPQEKKKKKRKNQQTKKKKNKKPKN